MHFGTTPVCACTSPLVAYYPSSQSGSLSVREPAGEYAWPADARQADECVSSSGRTCGEPTSAHVYMYICMSARPVVYTSGRRSTALVAKGAPQAGSQPASQADAHTRPPEANTTQTAEYRHVPLRSLID
eukprot:GHVU01080436.1.p1 GENE.GHVU01080436.1~~GHVU01080436.1.p1  ORF type:complete len:130 (-),score=2.42 GHVU01080436.1:659-1048(-)